MTESKELPIGNKVCPQGGTLVTEPGQRPIYFCHPIIHQNCPANPLTASKMAPLTAITAVAQVSPMPQNKPCFGCKTRYTHTVGQRPYQAPVHLTRI